VYDTFRMQLDAERNPVVDPGTRRLWGLVLACPGLSLAASLLILGLVQDLGPWESSAYPLFPITVFLLAISPLGVLVSRGVVRWIAAIAAAASYAILAWVVVSIQ